MANTKKIYSCNNCGAKYPKWMGQCSQCGEWNSVDEEIIKSKKKNESNITINKSKLKEIKEIETETNERIIINDNELNRVLGGGIVPGSVILISGEPGIGKSTLILQISISINKKVLYISDMFINIVKSLNDKPGSKTNDLLDLNNFRNVL